MVNSIASADRGLTLSRYCRDVGELFRMLSNGFVQGKVPGFIGPKLDLGKERH